jgi:hypothetical protein
VDRLSAVKNNYFLGHASIALLRNPRASEILKGGGAKFGRYEMPFAQIADLLSNPASRDEACQNFLVMHMSALIKDSFEMCRAHCKRAGRMTEMRAESWYHFCRLVRNCITHSSLFEFSPGDLQMMPVTWNGLTITSAFAGKPLMLEFFTYAHVWEMFMEIQAFAERTGV